MSKAAKGQLLPGYETVIITKNELTDDALKAIKDRLSGIPSQFTGETVTMDDWGKRKLAYPIERETRGQYTYFVYTGKSGVVAEVERNLRLNENVLRFLTINLETEFDKDEFLKNKPVLVEGGGREYRDYRGGDRGDRGDYREHKEYRSREPREYRE